jgi:aerobic carbon-monoxide dehydrogenase medium subunit
MMMIPATFSYHVPSSVAAATALLVEYQDDAKILSGGQSLIPLMKLRLATPKHLIDINRIPGLAYIRRTDGVLAVGALVREADLEESDLVRTHFPILIDTTRMIADPLVRNLATVCGNLAHADPANDHPSTMLALGADVVAAGPGGERRIPLSEFFVGPFTTTLRPDEIVTEVRIPIPPARSGGAYVKLERKVGDFATAAAAAQVTLASDGACERAGIGLTNVGLTPIRARRAEESLRGTRLDDGTINRAAELAAVESQPESDLRGSADYKRDMVRVLTARALRKARERAGGGR